MASVTQWLMLKSSDVFWKCNRSNFQPMSQEICMFQWIKIKTKAGCVGRPGSDRIIPSCFLGCRVIAKWGFLPSLFNPHHWILEGCSQWVQTLLGTWMFCTTGKFIIRFWPENKPQWAETVTKLLKSTVSRVPFLRWAGFVLMVLRKSSIWRQKSECSSGLWNQIRLFCLATGKGATEDKACTQAALYSISRKASQKIRFSFCTLTKSCTDCRSLRVTLTTSTAAFRGVAAALPHLVLLPSLFATSPAPGSWGCCGCASPRAWKQRVHGRAFWVCASNGKLRVQQPLLFSLENIKQIRKILWLYLVCSKALNLSLLTFQVFYISHIWPEVCKRGLGGLQG